MFGGGVFRWAATHVMPWLACFMAGAFWADNRAEIEDLRAERESLIRQDAESAGRVTALAEWLIAERADKAALAARRNSDHATFEKQLEASRVVIRACVPDPRERDGLRQQIAAANAYALGSVRSREAGDPVSQP